MLATRRTTLLLGAAALSFPALADTPDPRLGERVTGSASAPVTVTEFYSLTCQHCARFTALVMPKIKSELIDTGKLRYVFSDFPLDRTALYAAMVARALPADRYAPFCSALLASQDRWAFNRQADPMVKLAEMAAMFGMPKATFDSIVSDNAYRDAILGMQAATIKDHKVDSTPTFLFAGGKSAGKQVTGEQNFELFATATA